MYQGTILVEKKLSFLLKKKRKNFQTLKELLTIVYFMIKILQVINVPQSLLLVCQDLEQH